MADGYIDLSPIVSAVNSAVNRVGSAVADVDRHVGEVRSEVFRNMGVLKNDLENLKKAFIYMMEENRREAALQRALTEIIRVRQELERDFGNYKLVRNTMLGILEATDLQLVSETTITTCTEELMLSTPRYWLAPVLIALSAWIADNKPLAVRALKEALRRDEEKTCLTFALICRRNKRTKACFEWLSRYFSKQKASDMKESIIAYIDAYTNGVFGEDRDNLCEEYIENWMRELQTSNADFAEQQINYWKNYYITYCRDTSAQYPKLAECSKQDFAKMNDYVMRINSAPEIISFFAKILETEVDQQALVVAIDNELIKLVKNYDVDEAPLREEEEYLTDIKKFNGDEKKAKQLQALRKAKRADLPVNLATRLSNAITSNRTEDISAKKTAIMFMQGYIKEAFKNFIEEKAPSYPKEITVSTHGWSGKATESTESKVLNSSFEKSVNERRSKELATVKNGGMITLFVFAAIFAVALVVGFFMSNPVVKWMLIVLGVIGIVLFGILGLKKLLKNKKKRLDINSTYDKIYNDGRNDIELALKQLTAINQVVKRFSLSDCCEKLLLKEEN